ncbi:hypothetical protein GW7_16440, partial [Heterocephalus glaber]
RWSKLGSSSKPSCLGLPECWDYRHAPPCPAHFSFLRFLTQAEEQWVLCAPAFSPSAAPPASASQDAGITGMYHHGKLSLIFLFR